jgi:Tfp pilus assembly protein PilE
MTKIIAIIAGTICLAGCERDELEAIADRASVTGSLESSSSLIEQYYYIQKYNASAQQTQARSKWSRDRSSLSSETSEVCCGLDCTGR